MFLVDSIIRITESFSGFSRRTKGRGIYRRAAQRFEPEVICLEMITKSKYLSLDRESRGWRGFDTRVVDVLVVVVLTEMDPREDKFLVFCVPEVDAKETSDEYQNDGEC